jgi:hypothetical protein
MRLEASQLFVLLPHRIDTQVSPQHARSCKTSVAHAGYPDGQGWRGTSKKGSQKKKEKKEKTSGKF